MTIANCHEKFRNMHFECTQKVQENNFFLFLTNDAKRPEKLKKNIFTLTNSMNSGRNATRPNEKLFFSPNLAKRREKCNLK